VHRLNTIFYKIDPQFADRSGTSLVGDNQVGKLRLLQIEEEFTRPIKLHKRGQDCLAKRFGNLVKVILDLFDIG
jgi:hypothetical protein